MSRKIAVPGLGEVGTLAAGLLHGPGFHVTGVGAVAPRADLPVAVVEANPAGDVQGGLRPAGRRGLRPAVSLDRPAGGGGARRERAVVRLDRGRARTADRLRARAPTPTGQMAPRRDLAPGIMGIVGAGLIDALDSFRATRMRFGPLPQHATGLVGHFLNRSLGKQRRPRRRRRDRGPGAHVRRYDGMDGKHPSRRDAAQGLHHLGRSVAISEARRVRVANSDDKTMLYPGQAKLMKVLFGGLPVREGPEGAGRSPFTPSRRSSSSMSM